MLNPPQLNISQLLWLTSLCAIVVGLMMLLARSAQFGDESMLGANEQAIVEQLRATGVRVDDRFT